MSSDDNYVKYLAVLLESIKANASASYFYNFYVIDDNISEYNKYLIKEIIKTSDNFRIEFIDISMYIKEIDQSIFYTHRHFSKSTYYRFFLARIFKELDKILYLDLDTICIKDIADLYNVNVDNYYAAVVRDYVVLSFKNRKEYLSDIGISIPDNYFQAGVLLLNLKNLRNNDTEKELISTLIKVNKPYYVDQDILNIVFQNKVCYIEPNWNVEWSIPILFKNKVTDLSANLYKEYLKAYANPYIIHYCGQYKPENSPSFKYAYEWWKYARKSPYYEEFIYTNLDKKSNSIQEVFNKQIDKIKELEKLKYYKFKFFKYRILANIPIKKLNKKYKEKKLYFKNKYENVKNFKE